MYDGNDRAEDLRAIREMSIDKIEAVWSSVK